MNASAAFQKFVLVFASSLLAACGPATDTEKPAAAQSAPASSAPPAAAAPAQAPFVPVDACTLLTKADVEGLAGKPVMDARKEELGPLVTCSFDDPTAPKMAGRALSQVLTLSVMTGQEGAYYAGAIAQAKDVFLTAKKNAAKAEAVTGLGDDAYWDSMFSKLSVVKGRHFIDVDVESDGDALKVARAAATKALERLPQ